MGYAHINNLYADQRILMFRECYALEKVDGTSASVAQRDGNVWFSSGGASPVTFEALFDKAALAASMRDLGYTSVTIHGEAYGGKQQGLAARYGDSLRFVAFDVMLDGRWADVPTAEAIVHRLGLRFVRYARVPTDLAALDAERDAPSEESRRNGVEGDKPREGVVLRPIVEMVDGNGDRVIAKHKRDDERETKTPRKVVDPSQVQVLADAQAIADEWVTATRLDHVLDKFGPATMADTSKVIAAMVADVVREAGVANEIVDSKAARAAIGKRAAAMFHARLKVTR